MEDDEDGLTLCTARPEFAALSEADVWKAIAGDKYGESPITGEVTRLGVEFMTRFRAYADRSGAVPDGVVKIEARCPIERIAILSLLRYVEARGWAGRQVSVH